MRAAAGVSAIIQGGACLLDRGHPALLVWVSGLLMATSGASVVAGFLTPIVSTLVGIGILGMSLSALPVASPNLLEARTSEVLALTVVAAIGLIGPGAFSIDAHLFGRREILIPPSSHSPQS